MTGGAPELPLVARDGRGIAAAHQLDLPLACPAGEEPALIVTAVNATAVAMLERPEDWPGHALVLAGPRRSGRSLHARLAAARGARVLDGADARAEDEVFDAWNAAQSGAPLLLVADQAPPGWRPALPDLRSRLAASGVAVLSDPDDAMVDALLELLLLRRGVTSSVGLRREAAQALPRTHLALTRFVDALPAPGTLSRDATRRVLHALGMTRLKEAA